jgi:hypothetical protein
MAEGALLGPAAIAQLQKLIREHTRRMRNPASQRRQYGGPRDPGGQTQIINFQIISSDPTNRSALVQIEQRAFRGTVYGSILEDSVVSVYDTLGCNLNEPNVDLTGRFGQAVLMYTDDAAAALHFSDEYEPPERYWCVTNICCPQVVCEE